MVEKARLVAMKLDEANKLWRVKFSMPIKVETMRSMSVAVDAEDESQPGPARIKTLEEVSAEAHKKLANSIWPALRSVLNAMEEGTWDNFITLARSDADDSRRDPDGT